MKQIKIELGDLTKNNIHIVGFSFPEVISIISDILKNLAIEQAKHQAKNLLDPKGGQLYGSDTGANGATNPGSTDKN